MEEHLSTVFAMCFGLVILFCHLLYMALYMFVYCIEFCTMGVSGYV